jgi:hypothetical protein
MPRITRLKPAPVAYPEGGGLKAMAMSNRKLQDLELAAHQAASDLKAAQIKAKHSKKSTPAAGKPKANPQGTIPKKPKGA